MKQRLDKILFSKGLVRSRSQATDFIKRGFIKINNIVITKPGFLINEKDNIKIDSPTLYVGRGAEKLVHAIETFKIDFKNKIVIDVGSSTGGFTEVALNNDAKLIYAVDVGTNQLDSSLRNNPKVVVMEQTDIRDVSILSKKAGPFLRSKDRALSFLNESANIVLIDVSFISLEEILQSVFKLLKKNGEVVLLVKPQFESGVKGTKKGIVKNNELRATSLKNVKKYAENSGFKILGETDSPITGKKGNHEFFLYLKK